MAKESFQAGWRRWIDEATEDLIKFVGYAGGDLTVWIAPTEIVRS